MGGIGSAVGSIVGSIGGGIAQGAGAHNDFTATGANLDNTDYQKNIANALGTVGQTGQADQTRAQQQALIQALQQQAAGNGPSVAQNQLTAATGQNNANAAALIASQKGLNPALAARQVLETQAANNQTAANQSAQLKAQEQLAGTSALGTTLTNVRGQDVGQQAQNTQNLATLGGLQNAQNQTRSSNALGTQQINAGVSGQNAQINGQIAGGLLSGIGGGAAAALSAAPAAAAAYAGGQIPEMPDLAALLSRLNMASGGPLQMPSLMQLADPNAPNPFMSNGPGLGTAIGLGANKAYHALTDPSLKGNMAGGTADIEPSVNPLATSDDAQMLNAAMGGKVPVMVSPGEAYVPPDNVADVLAGEKSVHEAGKKFKGKAKVKGDSPKNDTIPTELEEGGFVIPRSVMQSENPSSAAADFINDHINGSPLAHDFLRRISEEHRGEIEEPNANLTEMLDQQKQLHARLSHLEKMFGGGGVKGC